MLEQERCELQPMLLLPRSLLGQGIEHVFGGGGAQLLLGAVRAGGSAGQRPAVHQLGGHRHG